MARSFDFINFEPSVEFATEARSNYLLIEGASPSDSVARGHIKKTLKGFEGLLQIHSTVGSFVVHTLSESPQKALEDVCRKILSQLGEWKRARLGMGVLDSLDTI